MSLVLTIKQDTWLKTKPVDSNQLAINEKLKAVVGEKFAPLSWELAINQHIKFHVSEKSFLYAFAPHITLTKDGVDALAPKLFVTADQFYAIAPQTSLAKLAPLVDPLSIALAKYSINTPLRICHFLAQTCHESDQYNTTEEYASGADYEWDADLGNTQKGDGVRFKGRSLICVTGRNNYKDCGDALGFDFVSSPELLASPEYAWLGACWFWDTHQLNNLADQDRFRDITLVINGGTNGIDQRLEALERAKQIFGI